MKKEEQDVDFEKRIRNLEKNVNKKEEKEKEIQRKIKEIENIQKKKKMLKKLLMIMITIVIYVLENMKQKNVIMDNVINVKNVDQFI